MNIYKFVDTVTSMPSADPMSGVPKNNTLLEAKEVPKVAVSTCYLNTNPVVLAGALQGLIICYRL